MLTIQELADRAGVAGPVPVPEVSISDLGIARQRIINPVPVDKPGVVRPQGIEYCRVASKGGPNSSICMLLDSEKAKEITSRGLIGATACSDQGGLVIDVIEMGSDQKQELVWQDVEGHLSRFTASSSGNFIRLSSRVFSGRETN